MKYIFFLLMFAAFNSFEQTPEVLAGGIGARIKMEKGYPVIAEISENSPAQKAGLKPEDIILKIDAIPAKDFELEEAIVLIRGPVGKIVKLKIKRGAEELEFDVERQRLDFSDR